MKKYFVLLFILIGCNNGASTPEGVIKKFVADSVKGKVDRDYYEKYTTGSILEASKNLTDEQVKDTALSSIKSVKTKIITKNCGSDKCVITYLVTYFTNSSGKGKNNSFSTEVKKIAEVEKNGEIWKIAKVKNIKTYHESLKPLNPLEN